MKHCSVMVILIPENSVKTETKLSLQQIAKVIYYKSSTCTDIFCMSVNKKYNNNNNNNDNNNL